MEKSKLLNDILTRQSACKRAQLISRRQTEQIIQYDIEGNRG